MISLIILGSDILATPPSFLMSAGNEDRGRVSWSVSSPARIVNTHQGLARAP